MLNDAISLYFADATLASAFVARWCVSSKVETAGGVFQVRENEPAARVGWGCTGRREARRIALPALVHGSRRELKATRRPEAARCLPAAGYPALALPIVRIPRDSRLAAILLCAANNP